MRKFQDALALSREKACACQKATPAIQCGSLDGREDEEKKMDDTEEKGPNGAEPEAVAAVEPARSQPGDDDVCLTIAAIGLRRSLSMEQSSDRVLMGGAFLIGSQVQRNYFGGEAPWRGHQADAGVARIRPVTEEEFLSMVDASRWPSRWHTDRCVGIGRYDLDAALERVSVLVQLKPSDFDALWNLRDDELHVVLQGRIRVLEGDAKRTGFVLDVRWIEVSDRCEIKLDRVRKVDERRYLAFWSRHTAPFDRGQTARILSEFAQSAARAELSAVDRGRIAVWVSNVMNDARRGFFGGGHSINKEAGLEQRAASMFEFQEICKRLDAGEAELLQYEQRTWLWKPSQTLERFVATRGWADELKASGIALSIDALVDLAHELSNCPNVYSRTLESFVLGALTYELGTSAARDRFPDGLTWKEMESTADPRKKDGWTALAERSKRSAKHVVIDEAIFLPLTFVVAFALAWGNLLTAWIITTGLTAARWIVREIRSSGRPEDDSLELVRRIVAYQQIFSIPGFSAQLALSDFKAISRVASPAVANAVRSLLDARARRDDDRSIDADFVLRETDDLSIDEMIESQAIDKRLKAAQEARSNK